ncbi:MAG TPA: ADOP family duplicated permease, partial [Gammaproteobacteria bacterium]|nr:ADOP family duplicated permease [Gammaproteobacteria bacterium]
RDEIERALDADLADYIERSAAEKVRAGMSEREARRAARIELGGVEQTKESVRTALSFAVVDNALADLAYAIRTLSRQKTFTTVAVLTLALGIGVNVAIFSLFQQILLGPLPVPEPDRLVNLTDPVSRQGFRMYPTLFPMARSSESGSGDTTFSYPMFRDLERAQEPFLGLAAHRFFEAGLSTGERTRLATGALVSGSYFAVLRLNPALGRLLGPEDDRVDGQAESVVLSHAYWQSEFAGDPSVLGRALFVNDVPLTIVGVAPEGFHGTAVSSRPSVFVPITIAPFGNTPASTAIPNHERRDHYWVHLFARLEPGVTREAAAAALNPLYRAILSEVEAPLLINVDEQRREAFLARTLVLEPGARGQTSSEILAPARNSLELQLAVSGGVLLLCFANVAGLMLLRTTARSGEIAVREALGATGARLAMLQLSESLVLALPAALLSLPVAWAALAGARRVPGMPAAVPDAGLSAVPALVAIGAAVAVSLAVGLVPVRRLVRTELGKPLQSHGARHTATKGVARFRAALATAQVALSMALLAMTGVFAQSLANIARLDLGVDIDSVVTFSISFPPSASTDRTLLPRVTEALEAMPRVSSVATSLPALLSLDEFAGQATIEGLVDDMPFARNLVSPDFFRTFGIELLAGREFSDTDLFQGRAIVSRRFAERLGLAPDEIVGRRADLNRMDITGAPLVDEIIGVVGDMRSGKITDEIEPQVFQPGPGGTFYVRGAPPSGALIDAVRETVARVAPSAAIANLQTMQQQFRNNIAIERFFAGTATAFAVLTTVLAALGLYGVLAYSVTQRSREIALRVALGAAAGRIRGMVLRQVTGMAVVGVVLGAAAAAIFGRAAQSLLFGVEAADPLALAAAAVVLTAVMIGAAYIPARRASRVDPMSVLRYE